MIHVSGTNTQLGLFDFAGSKIRVEQAKVTIAWQ